MYISGQFLPGSNEKVVTVTGTPECVGVAMRRILAILAEEGSGGKGSRMWDMDESGPVGFFGEEATWNGSGLPPGFTMMKNNMMGGGGAQQSGAIQGAWPGVLPPEVNPFLQKIYPEPAEDGSLFCKANLEQVGMIMGDRGARVKEIRRMSGANIVIEQLEGDACMRNLSIVTSQYSNEHSLQNATWLINICLNAFTEPQNSLIPFSNQTSLQDVVLSEKYGKPPAVEETGESNPSVKVESGSDLTGGHYGGMNVGGGAPGGGFGGPPGGMQSGAGGPMRRTPMNKW